MGPLTLPHDAMLTEERDPETSNGGNTGFYPGGVYRYSKTFHAPADWAHMSVVLEFEGVYQNSQVFLNGVRVGGRPSGYALFHVPLDEHLRLGEDNTVEVLADNSSEPNSRWYTGSGIYRPVHLLVSEQVHITPTGLRLSTVDLTGTTAVVAVVTTVVNQGADVAAVTVSAQLARPDGAVLAPETSDVVVPPGEERVVRQQVVVGDADLWSPTTPQLHTATVTILDGPEVQDVASDEFGIRTVTADARHGLRINGVPVKLRGSAVHHDAGVIGAHTLDAAEDRRIRLMKEAGYNAVRSAHNPASRALLRACDRHGFLVMDELTDAWFRPKVTHDYSELFVQWWQRDLEALVANAHNHPSVIMYSIGNEIAETSTRLGIDTNRMLARATRELDPTRLVTNGINGFLNLIAPQDDEKVAAKTAAAKNSDENPNRNLIRVLNLLLGVLDAMLDRIVRLPAVDRRTRDTFSDLDVAGYNYMVGRYELDGRLHPHRVIVGSETRAALTADVWPEVEFRPHVIGDFSWTGWDYIGEAGLAAKVYGTKKRQIYYPYPALLAGEPVIDITGFRQTQAYLNEIAWHLSSGPHIAVEPVTRSGEVSVKKGWRATDSVASWSWAGCEGQDAVVEVYTDAPKVELFLNGTSVGQADGGRDGTHLTRFRLPYQPGELLAVASTKAGAEVGRRVLRTAGDELVLTAVPETTSLRADGADLVYLPVLLTDAAGELKPGADRSVTVTVEGPATLLGLGSGEPITEEGFASDTHRTYFGRALAVLRSTHESGEVAVTVSAPGCAPVMVHLDAVAAPGA
ncbi:glycoside hydrolase family 2 protein [Geodermatophilaceae bacterium NBWT11]|nr:glycoside hydrolase family 2 protein [Geodermatophilaceae bacterium NBWT11]